jgi:hypothetical protein
MLTKKCYGWEVPTIVIHDLFVNDIRVTCDPVSKYIVGCDLDAGHDNHGYHNLVMHSKDHGVTIATFGIPKKLDQADHGQNESNDRHFQ